MISPKEHQRRLAAGNDKIKDSARHLYAELDAAIEQGKTSIEVDGRISFDLFGPNFRTAADVCAALCLLLFPAGWRAVVECTPRGATVQLVPLEGQI